MTRPKIKPCPDCGNTDMSMFGYGDWQPYNWHVECEECDYLGPCGNKLNAVREHNASVAARAQQEPSA